jgi:hypothetical protein
MESLTEVLDILSEQDQDLEKQASELMKVAEEHDAAGRIMARGFMDELTKLSGFGSQPSFQGPSGGTVKSGPYQTGSSKGVGVPMDRSQAVFGKRKSQQPFGPAKAAVPSAQKSGQSLPKARVPTRTNPMV